MFFWFVVLVIYLLLYHKHKKHVNLKDQIREKIQSRRTINEVQVEDNSKRKRLSVIKKVDNSNKKETS